MAFLPKPIVVTQTPTAGVIAPEPLVIVGNLPENAVMQATTSVYGTVKKATTVAAASGTVGETYTTTEQATIQNLQTQFNALLTALKNAGVVTT